MRKKFGFSLVEMLVALAVFSLVAIAIHSVLRAGLNTWRSGNEAMSENQALRNFFYTFSKDLSNSLNYSKDLPFVGEPQKISFITISGGRLLREVVFFDPKKKSVMRIMAGPEEGLNDKFAKPDILVSDVESLEFTYAFKGVYETEEVRWQDRWRIKKKIPRGVRVQINDWRTTVFIPTGEIGNDSEIE